jgi:predicted ATPase/GAF domain-containing protein/anti-anti-sigma regulatory factor/tRNA A-37 threonylcarbamoyl transferase component Bud32
MLEIAGYTLEQIVYEGAETTLHRGYRRDDGARVAAKVTRDAYPTWRTLSRLRREHGILAELDLPGVPRAIELVPHGRGLALIMEDLGPTSLADLIAARGRLDSTTVLTIALPLVRTLAALHRRRILHKDIKPHNVMIDEATLAPRLVDFGIAARVAHETHEAAAAVALEGTLAYIAPEQTGRMNRPVDRRADLYSLGATLYEMATGSPPFSGGDAAELIHAHLAVVPVPLHEREPGVSRALSQVVARLLAKAPEDRYRSARGLAADLEACLREIQAGRPLSTFPLGREDRAEEIVLPNRLLGREGDLARLDAALREAQGGALALALVAGPSGIGKSALARELCAGATYGQSTFASGKFDPTTRGTPLAAIMQAARALCRQALAEPPAALAEKKRALAEAFGTSGRLLTDLCPDLELLLGPQPEPPVLGASEARNRFALLIRRFFSVFASESAPLVLFLDDLQWADPASLELFGRVLADPEARHMLIIGAYRDDEVNAAHPLRAAIEEAQKAGIVPIEITLGPLSAQATRAFVAEALGEEPSRVAPLAQVVWDKTQGNPFFLGQFLRALAEDGLLRTAADTGAFVWDLDGVRAAMVADNVLALMARNIDRLAPETRRAVTLASAIGPSFDLGTLSTLLDVPPAQAAAALWEALREELVLPLGGDYRLIQASADVPAEDTARVRYQFLHDRVQEAFYARVPEEERPAVHLTIGRLLASRAGGEVADEQVLDVARHLNLGAAKIESPDERLAAARLDLRAGRRSMAATAYQAAAELFAAGRAFAGEDGLARDHDLGFALWIQGAECEYLSGAFEQAEALMSELLSRSRTPLERARVFSLRVRACATRGRFADAVQAGCEGLAALEAPIPDGAAARGAAFMHNLGEVDRLLGDRAIESLADEPVVQDDTERMILTLLSEMSVPVYYVDPGLYGLINTEQVRRSLARGLSPLSAFAYTAYGFMIGAVMGRPAVGHAFGRLALRLCERFANPGLTAQVNTMFANLAYVGEPIRNAYAYGKRGIAASIEAGDNVYLASGCFGVLPLLIGSGMPIEQIRAEAERCLALAKPTKDAMAIVTVRLSQQLLACLSGETDGLTRLEAEGVDIEAEIEALDEKTMPIPVFYLHAYRLLLHVIHGQPAAALAAGEEAARRSGTVMGLFWTARVPFLLALARAALGQAAQEPEARQAQEDAIAPLRARIATLAEACPANFKHAQMLIDAELAALAGKPPWQVLELYDAAIDVARENDHPHDEALASERAGRFLLARGRTRAARGYLTDAIRAYRHWGAAAKAHALAEEMPDALPSELRKSPSSTRSLLERSTAGMTLLASARSGTLRDAALLLRAAQAIAGELVLSKVIGRLMRTVLENAGAERGALLLGREEGELAVEATFQASPEAIEVGLGRPLAAGTELVRPAVLFAFRTHEPLVVDDALLDPRFAPDPRVGAGKARSLLCLPVIHQGKTTGVLYLENGAASGAFTAARVELLGLLASQAAIAIENAALIARVEAANARLGNDVQARTTELQRSNEELFSTNAKLALELKERERAEAEREALREEMLAAQQERISELSAPLLPISEDVLVMPIIGAVDRERAAQIMDTALTGAQRTRARVVILDLTGMRSIDTTMVSALLSVATALRLLGTQPLITGIRPDLAQTMTGLGVDLQGLTTLSTLRAGIALVLGGRSGAREPASLPGDERRKADERRPRRGPRSG